MSEPFSNEKIQEGNWQRPILEEEMAELQRTSAELGISLESLTNALAQAGIEDFTDTDWLRTENCDSRDATWTAVQVREHVANTRDFDRIERGLQNNEPMPAPIVLFRKDQNPYLIAGNSRLLACRVFQKKPKVLALHI